MAMGVVGIVKANPHRDQKPSNLEDDLAARVTCFARFMCFRRAIESTCQAHGRAELPLVSQLAEVSEVLPARPDDNSFRAFCFSENSGNRLNAAPEKEVRRRQRRHIGSAWREERPATDEGTLAHGVKDHIVAIQAGHEVLAAIVNDVVGPKRLDKLHVRMSTGSAGLCSERLSDLNGKVTDTARPSEDENIGTLRQLAQIAQRLQGSAACDRERRGLGEAQR